MRLTRASAYAIHAVAYMAAQKYDRPIASHHIALAQHPRALSAEGPQAAGFGAVAALRQGAQWRLSPGATPEDISMLDVIEAAEGPLTGLAPLHEDSADNPISERLANRLQAGVGSGPPPAGKGVDFRFNQAIAHVARVWPVCETRIQDVATSLRFASRRR